MKNSVHFANKQHREQLQQLRERFAQRKRPIRIVKKSEFWHQRAAGAALYAITFGGQNRYLSHYVTTLGHTIYVPDDFDSWPAGHALAVLRHEAVHVEQFERYGFPLMVLVYGLLPLPMGLSYFRARLEWEAYEETLRATYEIEGKAAAFSGELRADIVRRFTGPDYGFMWPFPRMVERWIDEALQKIDNEQTKSRSTSSQEPR